MKVTAQTVPRHRTRNSTITHGDISPGSSIAVVISSPVATVVDNKNIDEKAGIPISSVFSDSDGGIESVASGSEELRAVCDREVPTVDKTPVSDVVVDAFGEGCNRKVVFEGVDVTGFDDLDFTGRRLEYEDDNCVVTELDGMEVSSNAEESS